jgi:hypothetical protein
MSEEKTTYLPEFRLMLSDEEATRLLTANIVESCEVEHTSDVPAGTKFVHLRGKSSLMDVFFAKAPKHWKDVDCPTCEAKAGESCGRRPPGAPWGWERVSAHAARKRLAATS